MNYLLKNWKRKFFFFKPGPVCTPLVVASFPKDKNAKFGDSYPIRRPAQPRELAPAFVFLASAADSSYISG
jgi:NAD(P)-dependent dehydrogenase (short-subunit alcohol dehydrogenase family)